MKPKFPEEHRSFITVVDNEVSHHIVLGDVESRSEPVSEKRLKGVVEKLFGVGYVFYKSRIRELQNSAQHYDVKRLEA